MGGHRIYLSQRTIKLLLLYQAKDTIMPKALVRRIIAQRTVIVLDRLSILLLIDSAETAELIGADDISRIWLPHGRTKAHRAKASD